MATKSTRLSGPEAVQLQHHGGHERLHRLGQVEVDTKVANALLGAVTAAALASELASRDASISQALTHDKGGKSRIKTFKAVLDQ